MTFLSPQISHLVSARPMSVTMGNAIRQLKLEISASDIDMPEQDVRYDSLFDQLLYLMKYNTFRPLCLLFYEWIHLHRPKMHSVTKSTTISANGLSWLMKSLKSSRARKSKTGMSFSPTLGSEFLLLSFSSSLILARSDLH